MVALRGTNCSVNSMPHACMNHGNQSQQGSIDLSQGLQTSLNMSQGGVAQHMNANQLNGPPLSSVSVQFVPQQNNTNPLKRDRAPSQYANSNCMPSSHHYRLLTQSRAECWNPSGASGGGYMSSGVAGGQGQAQPTLRVQPNPQPSAPPAPQQDMSKTTMSGHNFVAPQNPTPQPRGQYPNFPYRPNQHGSRTNTHQRPQQPFMPNASATASAPVMYHPPTLVFQPHMVPPSYQQPRSTTPGYYQYVPQPYLGYTTPASHTPPYYYPSNNQQLPGQNLPNNPPGGRNNPTTMVGPQGTPVTAAAPTASIPHPQPTGHMHQPMPGTRQVPTKRSHRVPIIDPVTQQDILSELYSDNNSQYLSGESSERQTPQPESSPSIAEEFTRMVNEVANQPTVNESTVKASFVKNTDVPISSTSNATPHSLAINNHIKSELIVNEKSLGPDVAVESTDTPIVSAISDSPVIVPKMPINIKQIPKSSDPLPVAVDTSKNVSAKQQKQNRSKPLVPQGEDDEKVIENAVFEKSAMPVAPAGQAVVINAPVQLQPQPQPQTQTQPQPQPQLQPQPQPQPQRIREPRERLRSEEKEKDKKAHAKEAKPEPEPVPFTTKLNGPSPFNVISSVDSLPETINSPTSPSIQQTTESSKKQTSKQVTPVTEIDKFKPLVTNSQTESKNKTETPAKPLTATELLSASIEKCARLPLDKEELEEEKVEVSNAIQAQAKLTQSLISCLRNHQPEPNMKDVNLNKTSDPDTANGNNIEITITETVEEDINRNEKVVKNNQSSNKKSAMLANNESVVDETSYENGTEEETDTLSSPEQDAESEESEKDDSEVAGDSAANPGSTAFLPKYKYTEEQWSPLNKSGKKTYDISLLKQIKEDPLSKNKPSDAARLEACNVIRASPLLDTPLTFNISRPANDSIMFPNFFPKSAGVGPRNSAPRDAKKDSRNMPLSGKGSVKLQSPGGGGSTHKPVIHVSLSLREEVKLNQSKDAWKPGRFKKENLDEEELKTQELYRRFRGILNKLTPQKFDTLLEKVKSLEINNQKRLEGVIDLVFEKAIDEPNFSEAYAAMCNKLSVLKVPADNAPADQYVNFRALIINKCQNQFVTEKVDEQVLKLEKEFAECTEPTKKRELQLMLNEENRRVRMRSVGNVRFIGELYKLKMLTAKIMVFCMNYLIDKLEEEKLECLCKLLTTIGEQVESEVKEQLDTVFKKMVDIVERKSNKISSRVRFMIQDVIELRRRRWVAKNVVDLQPKMMDQIQKEAEQQQRHIELMNAAPMGGFRRDDGGRGKRGDSRRQNFNEANNWKLTRTNYVVDTSKLLKVTQKNISNIKLAPQNSGWNHGSGTKNTAQTAASNSMISLTKNNMYSMLENVQTDPATLRSNKDVTPNYSKGASIERSTFNSRGDFSSGSGSRSGSVTVPRSTSSTRAEATPPPPAAIVPQEPLPESQQKTVQSVLDLWIMNNPGDDAELAAEVKHLFKPQHHAAVVTQIVTIATQKSVENNALIAKSLAHLVSTNIIAADNVLTGLAEVLEFAPDTYIDVPLLYDNIAKFLALHIEKKHITLAQIFRISDAVISANQSNLLLKAIIRELRDSMGPSFVRSKWQESGIPLKKWMNADQVPKWLEENNFEFLEGETNVNEDTKNILSPAQTQNKLLQLMNADESCECIKGWIQDNLGHAATEDWFMRALIQAICEHALFGAEGRDVPHFNQDRMNKYCGLIEFGDSRQAREASCLFGIQQLIHRLEHPQGITLEIFQYLHEQYIINVEGFIAWEISKDEPEGKAVMLKALTSFFTNIKEADNEDSGSED